MRRIIYILLTIIFSSTSYAEGGSILDLNYLEITKNKILTEVMLELEPKLINYYVQIPLSKKFQSRGLKNIAEVLSNDRPNKSVVEVIQENSPDTPLKFLELDKNKYPNLWNFGEFERLKKKKEEALWLYKALHGKDYVEPVEK